MQIAQKEKRTVIYNDAATKILHFEPTAGMQCFVMHWHERMELIHLKKGELEYICGGKKGAVYPGDMLIVPPGVAHHARALTDSSYDVIMFDLRNFYNETVICKSLLPALFEGRVDFERVITDKEISDLFESICKADKSDSLFAVSCIYRLIHLLFKSSAITVSRSLVATEMRDVILYIEQNYDKDLSTDILCRQFGYTDSHFCRKFKKVTGLTPVTYIKLFRLEKAYKMLKQNEGQISEIAQQCGFPDSNYFTRCFKARYRLPPSYFKKEENQ